MGHVVVDDVASVEECSNLIRIHSGTCSAGYIDHVSISSLRDLLQCKRREELLFLVQLRERIREIVEERLNLFGELLFEWCSVTCWGKGSSLNKHFDSNRPYLEHRNVSAILYLNSPDSSSSFVPGFVGGDLEFYVDGHVERVVSPARGRLVFFSSGAENVHGVTPITQGKRYTLTLWFTKNRDKSLMELPKLSETYHVRPSLWETAEERLKLEIDMLDAYGLSLIASDEFETVARKYPSRVVVVDLLKSEDPDHEKKTLENCRLGEPAEIPTKIKDTNGWVVFRKTNGIRPILDFLSFVKWACKSFVGRLGTMQLPEIASHLRTHMSKWLELKHKLSTYMDTSLSIWKDDSVDQVGSIPHAVEAKLQLLLSER